MIVVRLWGCGHQKRLYCVYVFGETTKIALEDLVVCQAFFTEACSISCAFGGQHVDGTHATAAESGTFVPGPSYATIWGLVQRFFE